MTIKIIWNIIGIVCNKQLEEYADVITRIQYRCSVEETINDEYKYVEKEDWVDLPFNSTQPFISRDEITEEIILNWIWNGFVDKYAVESEVQQNLIN